MQNKIFSSKNVRDVHICMYNKNQQWNSKTNETTERKIEKNKSKFSMYLGWRKLVWPTEI